MKKIQMLFMALGALFMIVACSDDNSNPIISDGATSDVGISLSSEMFGSSTRATSDIQNIQVDATTQLGAFINDAEVPNSSYGYYNLLYRSDGQGTLTSDKQAYFPLKNKYSKVNIYAYAPYNRGFTRLRPYTFYVKTNQTTKANYIASDFIVGMPKTGNPVYNETTHDLEKKFQNVILTFNHLMTKVSVTLKGIHGMTQDEVVGAQIVMSNVATRTTIDVVNLTTSSPASISNITLGKINDESDVTLSAAIPPQTVTAGKLLFTVTLKNKEVYTFTPEADVIFVQGKHYHYVMTVGSYDTKVSTTVTDWIEAENNVVDAE